MKLSCDLERELPLEVERDIIAKVLSFVTGAQYLATWKRPIPERGIGQSFGRRNLQPPSSIDAGTYSRMTPSKTPDGRYLIVRGRLWRSSNPNLDAAEQQRLVDALMDARRAVKSAKKSANESHVAKARHQVDLTKRALGERGPVWWTDGTKDYNRHLVKNSPYARWYADETPGPAP